MPTPSVETPQPGTLPFGRGASRTGPNSGGVLILHATGQTYSVGDGNYCGQANLTDCDDAVVRIDSPDASVFHVLAAFPDGSSPRLAGVTFGIEYSDCIRLPDWAACGDFELPDPSWPASETGAAVTWVEAETTQLVDIYWFAGYSYGLPASFELVAHPTGGANFADDAVPSNIDPVAGFSMLGFYSPGRGACPEDVSPTGACCFPGGTPCVIVSETQCFNGGGAYFGDGSSCDPSPCGPTPTRGRSWGGIKDMFR